MNYEKVIMTVAVFTFIFTVGMSEANAKNLNTRTNSQGNKSIEEILESFEENDYDTWKKLVNPNSKIAKKINEYDFKQFVEMRKLMREGQYEEGLKLSERLKDKLNLNDGDMNSVVRMLEVNNR